MRPAKSLTQHANAGTIRPARHGQLLVDDDLPLMPPADSPACRRIWQRLRVVQHDYRRCRVDEVKRDIAVESSKLARDYIGARDHALPDPGDVIPGIREGLEINDRARAQYERELAEAAGGEAL